MREIRAKAIINAPARDVFTVLLDKESYPQFDPNCEKIDGLLEEGKRITVFSKLQPHRLDARVKLVVPCEVMIWESSFPLHWQKWVRTFNVIAKDDQTTEFQLLETQSGSLFVKQQSEQSEVFQQFAKGLKKYIEARP